MCSSLSDRGYLSNAYAGSLREFGRAVPFGTTGGYVLERTISGSHRKDMFGPYPVFTCSDWTSLPSAIRSLSGDPVTLTLVIDPFCPLPHSEMSEIFDVFRRFKDHWVIDLSAPFTPSRHHIRKLKQAGSVRVEIGPTTPLVPAFLELYRHLVQRKGISDLRNFSRSSLISQLAVPGAQLVTAWDGTCLLGADLYYSEGRIIRAHLSAYSHEGYVRSVSYPMMLEAVAHFRSTADVIDLGGTPAIESSKTGGGVGHFKMGWTRLSRSSFLCGKVFDHEYYAALSAKHNCSWFPAYRFGEFASTRTGRG